MPASQIPTEDRGVSKNFQGQNLRGQLFKKLGAYQRQTSMRQIYSSQTILRLFRKGLSVDYKNFG